MREPGPHRAAFKDHFTERASDYARYRPHYPDELFAVLAALTPSRALAWDCATGNGQAALGLAEHFEAVVATDASQAQIANAEEHPRVTYRVGRESESGLDAATVDLVTVAQAFHWVDAAAFWTEARRVLRPRGVAAIWLYRLTRVGPRIDPLVDRFYTEAVGPYWPPERRHIDNGYRELPFPLEALPVPDLDLTARWDLAHFLAYVRTWSGTRRCIAATGEDPVDGLERELTPLWGTGPRTVRWPLKIFAGTLSSP